MGSVQVTQGGKAMTKTDLQQMIREMIRLGLDIEEIAYFVRAELAAQEVAA